MKKLFLILIFCIFLCGCVNRKTQTEVDAIKDRGYLTVGIKTDSKPFGFIENGEIKGFDADISKKIAYSIFQDENKIKFVEVTSENRISKLINEEVDIIVATMTDTQDRREIVDFSEPYYISGQAVLCKKNSEVTSVADLSNHNTVVVTGTTAEKTLRQFYRRSNIIKVSNYNEAFSLVNNDTCMIADEALLQGFIIDNPNYRIFNKKLSNEPYAVAVRKDNAELKKYVDSTISKLKESGGLDKIKNMWVK